MYTIIGQYLGQIFPVMPMGITIDVKTESIRNLSNFNFQWTKTPTLL